MILAHITFRKRRGGGKKKTPGTLNDIIKTGGRALLLKAPPYPHPVKWDPAASTSNINKLVENNPPTMSTHEEKNLEAPAASVASDEVSTTDAAVEKRAWLKVEQDVGRSLVCEVTDEED